jgi:hypothetical protein
LLWIFSRWPTPAHRLLAVLVMLAWLLITYDRYFRLLQFGAVPMPHCVGGLLTLP